MVAAGIEEPVTLIPARQLDTEGSCPFTNSTRVFSGGSGILSCVFVSPARTGVYARWNFAHGNFAQRVALALLVPRNSPARPPRFLGYGTISAGSGQGTRTPVYLLKRIRRDPRV